MTEREWLTATNPQRMLAFLAGKASDRQLRLFACACTRESHRRISDDYTPMILQVAAVQERFADGHLPPEQLPALQEEEFWVGQGMEMPEAHFANRFWITFPDARRLAACAAFVKEEGDDLPPQDVCDLFREILGNPFRPVAVPTACRTAEVLSLAQAAYAERNLPAGTLDLARLLILADALEDAGCDNADLLHHLRSPDPHPRGCWAVDRLLGHE